MSLSLIMTLFTPGEAARITGVSLDLQRDWRRRGYLPASEGHARFNLFDLGGMLVTQMLSERGVGPTHTREVAPLCAAAIAYFALTEPGAVEGLDDRSNLERIKRQVLRDHPSNVFRHSRPGRFFIWWPDGTEWWDESIDRAFARRMLQESETGAAPQKPASPAIVIDLEELGELLQRRAGRPLVCVWGGEQ
jgi:hypothetical protein